MTLVVKTLAWWLALLVAVSTTAQTRAPFRVVAASDECTAGTSTTGLQNETLYRPSTSGPFPYNSTATTSYPTIVGSSYTDPTFGTSHLRLTADLTETGSDIYSTNAWWSADASRFIWTKSGINILNATTGAVVRTLTLTGSTFNVWFDPADATSDRVYYYNGANLQVCSIADATACLSQTNRVVKTFGATLASLGGTNDPMDRTGRYWVVMQGSGPRVWDKTEDALYTGAPSFTIGGGWCGMTPDGNYVVCNNDDGFNSYALNHSTNTMSTSPVMFWDLGGGHADLISASNGTNYAVVTNGGIDYDNLLPSPGSCNCSFLRNITTAATPDDGDQQQNNSTFILNLGFNGDGHVSASGGDWLAWAVEPTDDVFNYNPAGTWRSFMSEIVFINAVTLEKRRLAHHRSRSTAAGYYNQARPSLSWDGMKIAYTSNHNNDEGGEGYGDLYVLDCRVGTPFTPEPLAERIWMWRWLDTNPTLRLVHWLGWTDTGSAR